MIATTSFALEVLRQTVVKKVSMVVGEICLASIISTSIKRCLLYSLSVVNLTKWYGSISAENLGPWLATTTMVVVVAMMMMMVMSRNLGNWDSCRLRFDTMSLFLAKLVEDLDQR